MAAGEVEKWFTSAPAEQRSILAALREVVQAAERGVTEEFKWGRPCYALAGKMFCYLHRSKNHITIGFYRGSALEDPQHLLAGEGKEMRHVKVTTEADAKKAALRQLVKQAAKATT
ncbi:MAG TPA: DUF1801 domain-containing protein [Gemmatales bacterium]|nr:DUF1801 domain-containing protein [Gemmatales bacterium]HMP60329.1 DUF1801 domain-containing protein [Gemmatales bacterium]